MVLLSMTSAIVLALEATMQQKAHSELESPKSASQQLQENARELSATAEEHQVNPDRVTVTGSSLQEPSLAQPKIGNPISHGQVLALWNQTKELGLSTCNLETLLRGARVYVPPPPPKPELTAEYKALMARLRREEEERNYDRMTNPPAPIETFFQRFPASSAAHAFDSNYTPKRQPDPFAESDEVTYADVDRQMALIFNVIVSIVACAGAIWVVARWWSTPMRLALSMSGSILVGVAEVVVYSSYVKKVGDSKAKEKSKKEIKQIAKTWVLGDVKDGQTQVSNITAPKGAPSNMRQRLKKPT